MSSQAISWAGTRHRRGGVNPHSIARRVASTGWGLLAWICALIFFIPVGWMVLTAFKPETQTATWPPKFTFTPTLSEFRTIFANNGNGIGAFLEHSATVTIASTVLVLVLATPCAFALSIKSVAKWRDVLFFLISTKMLPAVAVIMPLYILSIDLHLLDHISVLILLYASMNLPLAVWMLRSFLLEIPSELLEAAELDGASIWRQIPEVILPMALPGLASTALICVIFAWNELFLATNLTATHATTMPVYVAAVPWQGYFYGTLAAEATVACLPVVLIGWIAQRQLVRGLSMGAIK